MVREQSILVTRQRDRVSGNGGSKVIFPKTLAYKWSPFFIWLSPGHGGLKVKDFPWKL